MTHRLKKDGYVRIVHDDSVIWFIDNDKEDAEFVIARFPFVPDYHLCEFLFDDDDRYGDFACERPLQHFKILTQALAVLKVLEGSHP